MDDPLADIPCSMVVNKVRQMDIYMKRTGLHIRCAVVKSGSRSKADTEADTELNPSGHTIKAPLLFSGMMNVFVNLLTYSTSHHGEYSRSLKRLT